MTRKTDLENHIRDSYNMIVQYEQIIRDGDPQISGRANRIINEQWKLIDSYLQEYRVVADNAWPSDIIQIDRRFSSHGTAAVGTPPTATPATPAPPQGTAPTPQTGPTPTQNSSQEAHSPAPGKPSWFKSLTDTQRGALIAAIATVVVALIALVGTLGVPLIEKWTGNPTSQPTTEVNPDGSFYYGVRVYVKDKDQVIQGAKVTIEVGGQAPIDDFTDSNGYTRILILTSHVGQPGRLIVEETGYQRWEQNIDLKPDLLPDIIELEPKP